jgi:phosphoribosylformylglycinamidine synthase subunit PurSL
VHDVGRCVTMDFKEAGNVLYLVGETKNELGGSHFALVNGLAGGQAPTVDLEQAPKTFAAMHGAIRGGLVRACHDLSEGGLAVAAAEMAFAGGLGARIGLDRVSSALWSDLDESELDPIMVFSESNTRFLCEVAHERAGEFEAVMQGIRFGRIGEVRDDKRIQIWGNSGTKPLIDVSCSIAKESWQATFRW